MRVLILGNSITSNLNVTGATTKTIPGLDWQGAQNYLLENRETLRNTFVYVIVGPVRFTSLHRTRREVAFVEPRKSVHQLFSVFYTEHKAYNIRPVIATIFPMSFTVYNRLKARRPIMTAFYREWDDKIRRYCVVENREIIYFNEKWGNQTPFIHRRLFHRHNQIYTFRAKHLYDGLHPKPVIRCEWARELRRVVRYLQ